MRSKIEAIRKLNPDWDVLEFLAAIEEKALNESLNDGKAMESLDKLYFEVPERKGART